MFENLQIESCALNQTEPPRQTVLGCIADDHTGATDIAGLLARSGIRVSLRLGVPAIPPEQADLAAFEVIALKCRTSPVDAATGETLAALDWLQRAGARRFFWKYCSTFDSTDAGNIGPVAQALMAALDCTQTIYCPAFPENGRSVFMGNLFVGEQPISESPMKDHPLTPMRDSNLMRVLAPQVSGKTGLVNRLCVDRGSAAIQERLAQLSAEGVAHVITDAVSEHDLQTIAKACHKMPLLTGGSALAMALPALYQKEGLLPAKTLPALWPQFGDSSIVLSGSCSDMTRQQVAQYLKTAKGYRLDPLVIAKQGPAAARDWLAQQNLAAPKIIYATADPESVRQTQQVLGTQTASTLIETTLAQLAVDSRTLGIRRMVIAGGETSGAITKALGVDQMTIGPEIAPGVPWTSCSSEGTGIALALKSGNFGDVDFFDKAFRRLDRI